MGISAMSVLEKIRWMNLQTNRDPRGVLTAIEAGQHAPFEIKRVFYMHDILEDRGGHAHRDTEQLIVPVHGQFKMDLSDGRQTITHRFDDATKGLYLPPMVFMRNIYDFSPGAVCLVL